MKIESIAVQNYRSIGDQGDFRFTSNIVALIGRNESGKSNVLDAFKGVRFFEPMGDNVLPLTAHNRFVERTMPLQVGLTCFFEDEDIAEIGLAGCDVEAVRKSSVWVRRDAYGLLGLMSGAYSLVVRNDKELQSALVAMKEAVDYVRSNPNNWNAASRERLLSLLTETETHWFPNFQQSVDFAINNVFSSFQQEKRKQLNEAMKNLAAALTRLYGIFAKVSPAIFRFDDAWMLRSEYSLDRLKERNFFDVALDRYLAAVDFKMSHLKSAFEEQDESRRVSMVEKFRLRTDKVVEKFNEHYLEGRQKIRFHPSFSNRVLSFSVGSVESEETMLLGERSAGLKWYLELYLELTRAEKRRNVLILIDEPAVHLHVNAQKEVLKLFDKLARDGRYLVYTTHSPYLINQEELGDVRGVVKDEKGIASVIPLYKVASQETLAPVCEVLGVDLKNNLGPVYGKKNLVSEGETDAAYLGAILPLLLPDEGKRPHLIACTSGNNIHSVVSILIAQGYDARAIVDNDCTGRTELKRVRKLFVDVDGGFNHVQPVSEVQSESIENLISASDYREAFGVDPTVEELKKSKALKARQFAEKVKGGWRPSEETLGKFRSLLHNLEIV